MSAASADEQQWWAEGDTPVRRDSRVTYLVDGHATLLAFCLACFQARDYIYLAHWGLTPSMPLVRGRDQRAGPDDSSEQQELVAELRLAGLSDEAIAFWCNHELTLQTVLGYAVQHGVEVRVLLWDCPEIFSHYHPQQAYEELSAVGVLCLLDDSSRGLLHHPAEALHQKTSVIDGRYAFVGGIDPLIENDGEFDRWDMHPHPLFTPLRRLLAKPASPHPWHDAHALIEGPAAADVELNFRQRWNDVVKRKGLEATVLVPEHPLPPPLQSRTVVQIARTIPQHTYSFTPEGGIQGIAQLYAAAFRNAQQLIYLENQYFWLRSFLGLNIPFIGSDSPDMEQNIRLLGEALRRGARLVMVLPDHPNVGRAFSDAGLQRLREEAPEAVKEDRLLVLTLATSDLVDGQVRYRPIYVHAKVALVDDLWSTVGSANLNNRGMRDDTELNVATLDSELARGLRLLLWGEHLGLVPDEDMLALLRYLGRQPLRPARQARARDLFAELERRLGPSEQGLLLLAEQARANLERYRAGQLLVGHVLPYLTADEAREQGLSCDEAQGWIEQEKPAEPGA
ncbi:phospholipase D-like domain-containing protein [Thermogemmatispora onikobensis]|uniref:phospholipase D-like domain-containing protein n=1 Tax=Thermogemmatispora onikobensis TaxID=732234 RepID=UPI000852BCA3|nr:phospholipase D family protein [Thermogemmatispora onikobensis]